MFKVEANRVQGLIAINLAAVIFGSAALYGKLDISPVWIVCMRALFACAALLAIGKLKSELSLPRKSEISTLVTSGVILAIHWMTFFLSVQLSGIATATLTFAAFPLFTVILETLLQKRKPHFLELLAGITIVSAVRLLINGDV